MRMLSLPDGRCNLRQSAKIREHSATPHKEGTTVLNGPPQMGIRRQAEAAAVSDSAHTHR